MSATGTVGLEGSGRMESRPDSLHPFLVIRVYFVAIGVTTWLENRDGIHKQEQGHF